MLPNLSALTVCHGRHTVDIGAGKRSSDERPSDESIEEVRAPKRNITYDSLIAAILNEFNSPLLGHFVLDPCGLIGPQMNQGKAHKRRNALRSAAAVLIEKSAFTRQKKTGETLKTPLAEATAQKIARLYFRTVDFIDGENMETGTDRAQIVMRREFGTKEADEVWRALAEDAYRALVDSGKTIKEGEGLEIELFLQRANEAAYEARASYVHMDVGVGESDRSLYGVHDRLEASYENIGQSFATSFCAQRLYPTSASDVPEILILDCGTILYSGVPVITGAKIDEIVSRLELDSQFEPCTDLERLVGSIATDLNDATIAALKDYSDEKLKSIGIEMEAVAAREWVDAHTRTFHRSPVYSDFRWAESNKPKDPWARAAWTWVKKMLGRRPPDETSQIRFFARLRVLPKDKLTDYRTMYLTRKFRVGPDQNVPVSVTAFTAKYKH